MPTYSSKIRNFIVPIIWTIFIFIISTIPGKDIPKFGWAELFTIDKWVHLSIYGILVFTFLRAYCRRNPDYTNAQLLRVGFIAAIAVSAYGWALEFIQENFCEDRLFEVFDGVANTAGAFLAFGIFYLLKRKR